MGGISSAIPALALVFAIVATVLAFVFIVPEKKRSRLNGFGKFLHDTVNFKFLIVEKILQALYILLTAFVILLGFFMLFYVQDYYYDTVWFGGYGILVMILGPIVIRLIYEFLMMAVLLVKNVIQINNKLKSESDQSAEDIFTAPNIQIPVSTSENKFCQHCGTKVTEGAFCPQCGNKL